MYKDFTKYMFQHFENAYNIGWKENITLKEKETNNTIDDKFIDNLELFCKFPINISKDGKYKIIEKNGEKYAKGFGEIRVLNEKNNIRYAAPNTILDDIIEGIYIPPQEFIKAVKNGPKPDEIEYKQFILKYTAKNYWGEDEEYAKKITHIISSLKKGVSTLKREIQSENIINCVTDKGSLLNYAIQEKKTEEALYLIESGIEINTFEGIELLNAIRNNLTEVAKVLIEKDIYMEKDELKRNPLFQAIRCKNKDIVLKLLAPKQDLVKTYSNEYVKNYTILDAAERCKDEEIIEIVKNIVQHKEIKNKLNR